MDAYWKEFGQTLASPPWGATIDAGAEDKESGWGMMRAALELVGTKGARTTRVPMRLLVGSLGALCAEVAGRFAREYATRSIPLDLCEF